MCKIELWNTNEDNWNLSLDISYKIKNASKEQRTIKNHKNDVLEEEDDKQSINEICNSKDFKEC